MSDFDQAAVAGGVGGGPPSLEPKRIKVFGVMHIVFGGLGLLQALSNVVMTPFQQQMMELSSTGAPEGTVEMQMEMIERLTPYTWISVVIAVMLGGLILNAGIRLVKLKPGAVKASNIYAWTSIAMKVVAIVLFYLMVLPVFNELIEGLLAEAGVGGENMLTIMRVVIAAIGVLGPVVMAIYPIVALVMLNKPIVKDFFAARAQ